MRGAERQNHQHNDEEEEKVFCTPGMCSALKVMLWSRRVSTSGLSIFMIVLYLLACLCCLLWPSYHNEMLC